MAGRTIKVFVVGFQESVVDSKRVPAWCRVGSKKNSILILQKKPARGIGLPTEFRNPGIEIDIHIGIPIKILADRSKIFSVVPEMCVDEDRFRMPRNHSMQLVEDRLTPGKLVTKEQPVRVLV